MSTPYPPYPPPAAAPTCYRHPDRISYVQCTRCGRFICPECMRSAPVGHQCVDCVAAATAATARRPRARFTLAPRTPGNPVITYCLIGANVLMFLLQVTSPGLERALVLWTPAVAQGELYRLVTAAFLHYSVMHLLFNMWALYVVGPPLEAALGRLRFGALYALSALGGSTLVYLASPLNAATAGASGAVFGLFGATYVVAKRLNLDVRGVTALIVINLVITFVLPGVSWQGHIGGLVSGAAIAAAYVYPAARQRTAVQLGASLAMLALFVVLVWWRTGVLLGYLGAG